jgi:hypothetical protein
MLFLRANATIETPNSARLTRLREKLRKVEALYAGAGTAGERHAAEAALGRLRARLAEEGRREAPAEMHFSIADPWARLLFMALCRRYGLEPYRYHRQRSSSVMVRLPKSFLDVVLWPEFRELGAELRSYLEVTQRVIREEVCADTSDAAEVPQALPAR